MRQDAEATARRFLREEYPDCEAALLAGSAAQGEATPTSDLDLVIFDESGEGPLRRTYLAEGWVIEAFVLTRDTYRYFFDQAVESAVPSLLRMCAEGRLLLGGEAAHSIIAEARRDLLAGPPPWSRQELRQARYELGETLADFEGSGSREEALFIAAKLALQLASFALRTRGQWLGDGKWLQRGLQRCDPPAAAELHDALEAYYAGASKEALASLTRRWLAPFGGILTEGYTEGGSGEGEEDEEEA
ncbi:MULTISPECIES: nucleotidyltransferase domain-containing protein [Paenibacillus]|uniref:nucleotidyltransferase domain-containing protein n=1 Tax=Paenibacillus TaxID=44249 RepID=UPI0022B93ED4|nr:nucleotidyltransferase domain-containing protein [Paenibacillus caseinilyticus]MCZ8522568.1 nucleotidyltransferase domain-containing protein [Paenibacillus caseinilyticus]